MAQTFCRAHLSLKINQSLTDVRRQIISDNDDSFITPWHGQLHRVGKKWNCFVNSCNFVNSNLTRFSRFFSLLESALISNKLQITIILSTTLSLRCCTTLGIRNTYLLNYNISFHIFSAHGVVYNYISLYNPSFAARVLNKFTYLCRFTLAAGGLYISRLTSRGTTEKCMTKLNDSRKKK